MKRLQFVYFLSFLLKIIPLSAQQGLIGEYYTGTHFNQKITTRIDAEINFNWRNQTPVQGLSYSFYSIRWTGRLLAPTTGTYTFSAKVDDGIKLWVGGNLIIDAWGLHDSENFKGQIQLEANKYYDLKVEFFNDIREGEIHLFWEMPKPEKSIWDYVWGSPQPISKQYFYQPVQPKVEPAKPIVKIENPPKKAIVKPKPTNNQAINVSKAPVKAPIHKDTIEKYTPKNILFQQSKSIMLEASFVDLDKLIGFLKKYPSLNITIEGHTDNLGDADVNLKLSEERALAVAEYLAKHGISKKRITAKGYGSTRPLIKNASDARNRRVEFIIN